MRLQPFFLLSLLSFAPAAASPQPQEAYPTIESAPPIAFDQSLPPPDDRPNNEDSWYARDQGVSVDEARRRSRLRRQVDPELTRVRQALEAREADNFAGLWIQHQPEWGVVFAFVREPEATLRRYTSNPLFVARQVRFSSAELEAARMDMFGQLERAGIPAGGGTYVMRNRVEIDLAVEQAELDRLVAEGRIRPSPMVLLRTPGMLEPSEPVAADARRFVRIFPQQRLRTGAETSELNIGTIVLRDGCLRLDGPGDRDPLAYFGAESGLKLDAEGLLTIYNRGGGERSAHVGEWMVLGGGAGREISDPAVLAPIRAACGEGPVVYVGNPQSYAAFRMAFVAWKIDALAARERISREEAFARMRACWAREDEAEQRARLAGAGVPAGPRSPPCDVAPPPLA